MVKCSHCKKKKLISKFRKTKKTLNGHYPVCKECLMVHKFMTRMDSSTVIQNLWFDLMDLAFAEPIATKIYFNKSMFQEYVASYFEYQELYKEWSSYEYDTKRLTLKLIKPLPEGTYSLENIKFFIRDLEENESLELIRNTQANRT